MLFSLQRLDQRCFDDNVAVLDGNMLLFEACLLSPRMLRIHFIYMDQIRSYSSWLLHSWKWKKLFEGFYDARMGRISRTKEQMSYDYIKDDRFVAIFMQTSSQTLISWVRLFPISRIILSSRWCRLGEIWRLWILHAQYFYLQFNF